MTNNCSLKYRLHYVEKRKPERISIALPFGKAMHAAEELFYRSLKHGSHKEPLNALLERFEAVLCQSLEKNAGTPVVWKKNMLDQAGAFAMGKSMLSAFYETIDLSGYAVVEVELPLSARLYTDDGLPTEFMLVGILDLLLMDENIEAVVVDNKTAAQPMSQQTADENWKTSSNRFMNFQPTITTKPFRCRIWSLTVSPTCGWPTSRLKSLPAHNACSPIACVSPIPISLGVRLNCRPGTSTTGSSRSASSGRPSFVGSMRFFPMNVAVGIN